MLKRTPLKPRKKLLKRGKAPKRSPLVRKVVTRVKAKGKPRFKQGRDPQYLEWIRGLPCILRGREGVGGIVIGWAHHCIGPVEASHVRSRGAGGADVGNTVPLCSRAHSAQHALGIKSWASHWFAGGLDELRRIAAEVCPQQYERAKALGWPE